MGFFVMGDVARGAPSVKGKATRGTALLKRLFARLRCSLGRCNVLQSLEKILKKRGGGGQQPLRSFIIIIIAHERAHTHTKRRHGVSSSGGSLRCCRSVVAPPSARARSLAPASASPSWPEAAGHSSLQAEVSCAPGNSRR